MRELHVRLRARAGPGARFSSVRILIYIYIIEQCYIKLKYIILYYIYVRAPTSSQRLSRNSSHGDPENPSRHMVLGPRMLDRAYEESKTPRT